MCEKISSNGKREIGFKALLKLIHLKQLLRVLIPSICWALIFHPVESIAQEVLKFGYGTTHDAAPKDAAVDHITHAHRHYIEKLLSVHCIKQCEKRLTCHQCPVASTDRWHEVWEARCDFDKHVVVSFERPLDARMRGIRLNPDGKRTLKNDIEMLKMVGQITTHPNIIKMLAFQNTLSPRFYVTECLGTSMTLSQFLIHRRNVRPQLTVIDLLQSGVLPIISAVQHCHDSGILLRNVTASAFLARDLGATFTVKLHTFHLARRGTTMASPPKDSKLCFFGERNLFLIIVMALIKLIWI